MIFTRRVFKNMIFRECILSKFFEWAWEWEKKQRVDILLKIKLISLQLAFCVKHYNIKNYSTYRNSTKHFFSWIIYNIINYGKIILYVTLYSVNNLYRELISNGIKTILVFIFTIYYYFMIIICHDVVNNCWRS